MKVIVYLLGLGLIAVSSVLILYTRETLAALKDLYQSYPLKYLAAIPLVVGILFLIAASATCSPWIFRLIGLLAFCEAVVAFTNPDQLYSKLLDWYFDKISLQTHQLFGIIGIIFGTVILTMAT